MVALGHFTFAVDRLSAFFVLAISSLALCVSIYSIGYTREYAGRYSPATMGLLFNIFLLSLYLVVTASNAVLFLIMWETMSLSSYLLVVYENRNRESVSSGLLYVVMTHLGTALITVAFIVMWLYTPGEHSFDFSAFRELGAGAVPQASRALVFVLLLVGFGTKAGLVPLHVWLPQAHPAAPSNVSAMMSGVMVKTAVYMLIRCYFDFLGVTDSWWGLVVLLVASISALVGVLYALMEEDIKRALAYSTVENIGLIFIGLGAAMVFQSYHLADPVANVHLADLAALALIAVLFHTLAHSLFKGLLFMVGAVVLSVLIGPVLSYLVQPFIERFFGLPVDTNNLILVTTTGELPVFVFLLLTGIIFVGLSLLVRPGQEEVSKPYASGETFDFESRGNYFLTDASVRQGISISEGAGVLLVVALLLVPVVLEVL